MKERAMEWIGWIRLASYKGGDGGSGGTVADDCTSPRRYTLLECAISFRAIPLSGSAQSELSIVAGRSKRGV